MEWIYKIRNTIPGRYIKYAIIAVLIAIFFNILVISTAQAEGIEDWQEGSAYSKQLDRDFWEGDLFIGVDEAENEEPMTSYENDELVVGGSPDYHEDESSIANSVHRIENSPYSIENSEHNLKNSRYSHGNHIIRDENGQATGYWKEREDGGVNIYGYDGKGRTGYIPAPR